MRGYFIDSDTMQELWIRLTKIELDNVNEVMDALGFAKGVLYPIHEADYEEIKPKVCQNKAESEDKE